MRMCVQLDRRIRWCRFDGLLGIGFSKEGSSHTCESLGADADSIDFSDTNALSRVLQHIMAPWQGLT